MCWSTDDTSEKILVFKILKLSAFIILNLKLIWPIYLLQQKICKIFAKPGPHNSES